MNIVELRKWSEVLLDKGSRLSEAITHYAESIDSFSEEKWDQDRSDERRTRLVSGINEIVSDVRTDVEEKTREESSSLYPDPVWVMGLSEGNGARFVGSVQQEVHPEVAIKADCVIMHLSKFVETCTRVKRMVERGDYDQDPDSNPDIILYREAWKDQIKLTKKKPLTKGTLTMRPDQKKSDSPSKRPGTLTLIDPDKKDQ